MNIFIDLEPNKHLTHNNSIGTLLEGYDTISEMLVKEGVEPWFYKIVKNKKNIPIKSIVWNNDYVDHKIIINFQLIICDCIDDNKYYYNSITIDSESYIIPFSNKIIIAKSVDEVNPETLTLKIKDVIYHILGLYDEDDLKKLVTPKEFEYIKTMKLVKDI